MISTEKCIGCQACVDLCPNKIIKFNYDIWGEGRAIVNVDECINCKVCEKICPSINYQFNPIPEKVYSCISKTNSNTGSSGGTFFEIAKKFVLSGGIVYGAAFTEELQLVHEKATTISEILPLCKSKYIHSDMSNIYSEIKKMLEKRKKILFVGTPCQVSAVKNAFYDKYNDSIYLIDFLCHGTGTQKIFDLCIKNEEFVKKGKIIKFEFRSKSKKTDHSFKYTLKIGNKLKTIKGYSFEFSYYYSFLKYTIFNESCYSCVYARNQRVGDITLGDFWGIQNYNRKLKDYKGVSMLTINSLKGQKLFSYLNETCDINCYPLIYATEHNESFNKCTAYPSEKKELVELMEQSKEQELIDKLSCQNVLKNKIYIKTPQIIRKIYKKLVKRK